MEYTSPIYKLGRYPLIPPFASYLTTDFQCTIFISSIRAANLFCVEQSLSYKLYSTMSNDHVDVIIYLNK